MFFILIYIYYRKKMRGFQYPNLHIMPFQASIEGYGRSKSYINISSNEYMNPKV